MALGRETRIVVAESFMTGNPGDSVLALGPPPILAGYGPGRNLARERALPGTATVLERKSRRLTPLGGWVCAPAEGGGSPRRRLTGSDRGSYLPVGRNGSSLF